MKDASCSFMDCNEKAENLDKFSWSLFVEDLMATSFSRLSKTSLAEGLRFGFTSSKS
jgi:hypothetical protein